MGQGDPLFAAEAIYARGTEVKLAFYTSAGVIFVNFEWKL